MVLFLSTDAVLTGTRRRVKLEKIPLLPEIGCAEELKAKELKENACPSTTEAVESPRSVDNRRDTLTSIASSSLSDLTALEENAIQAGAACIEKKRFSTSVDESRGAEFGREEEEKSQTLSTVNHEAVDSAEHVADAQQQPEIEPKSHTNDEPVKTSAALGREKHKPKMVHIRCPDVPDQNCKTQ